MKVSRVRQSWFMLRTGAGEAAEQPGCRRKVQSSRTVPDASLVAQGQKTCEASRRFLSPPLSPITGHLDLLLHISETKPRKD